MRRKKGLTFIEKEKGVSKDIIRDIFGTLFFCFAAALLAAVLVIAFGMRISVVGTSMSPSLENTQQVLVDRFAFKLLSLERNDVICFYPKGNENSHLYIKRVVALPGETVVIKDGYVYINGTRLLENDKFDKIIDPGLAEVDFKLGDDEYFVLGDNRNNSEDSRIGNIGAVKLDTIMGKVWFKLKCGDNGLGPVD